MLETTNQYRSVKKWDYPLTCLFKVYTGSLRLHPGQYDETLEPWWTGMELPIFDRNPHDQCNQSQPTTHNQQQTANNKQQQERRMLITMMIGIIVSTRASLGNLRTIPSPRSHWSLRSHRTWPKHDITNKWNRRSFLQQKGPSITNQFWWLKYLFLLREKP